MFRLSSRKRKDWERAARQVSRRSTGFRRSHVEALETRALLTGVATATATAHDTGPVDTGTGVTRIVGGTVSAPTAWPWMASLQHNGHFCGATLVTPDALVTAAHCVEGLSPRDLTVVLGKNDLSSAGGKLHKVTEIIVNRDYNSFTNDSDIAIVQLASPSIQKPIPVLHAEQADLAAPGSIATIAGWGILAEGSLLLPNELHEVSVPIVANQVANRLEAYDGAVTDNMLAAGLAAGGKDSCQGDSGGPLMVADNNGQFYLAGVVSWGDGCARPDRYGIYTRVTNFAAWIVDQTHVSAAGTVSLTQERYVVGQSAQILVRDANLADVPSIQVQVTTNDGDHEWVRLDQQFPGRYSGAIGLAAGDLTQDDGSLQVANSRTLDVEYDDDDAGDGQPAVAHDTARIVIDDFGNDAAHALPLVLPAAVAGEIDLASDVDWFQLTTQVGVDYSINVVLDGSLNDSELKVFDQGGTVLLDQDDDSGPGLASSLVWHSTQPAVINLQVSGYGSYVGTYRLVVNEQPAVPDDYGSSTATAAPIAVNTMVDGAIEVKFDRDWFAFEAVAGNSYVIRTQLISLNDSMIQLLDASGKELGFNDDEDPDHLNSKLNWRAPATSTYYVAVAGYDDAVGRYRFGIEEIVTPEDDHGDTAELATSISFPVEVAGNLNRLGDVDWFGFDAVEGAQYVFNVRLNSLPDSILRLLDGQGTELAYNDDYDINLASRISWSAPADGRYFVEVSGYGDHDLGAYSLIGTEVRPVGQDDHGDSTATATVISPDEQRFGATINRPHDVDFFAFAAAAGVVYDVDTWAGSLNDTQVVVYATDGATELARDDDSGVGFASHLRWLAPSNGTFYLAVSGYGTETGSYELRLRVPYGDADQNGRFDSTDLVQIFQAGKYESELAVDAIWSEGDWNGDHRFDTADLVAAFQAGNYQG